ncbi:MAG TPA: hypothetical protein VKU79_02640 [Thermoplasmataceae archaeon]|nr:hypothetical protein [Thermoplasmatales archaeon AK]HLH85744.1 hypothetical protein [Thermoplasmataceae archaeon]
MENGRLKLIGLVISLLIILVGLNQLTGDLEVHHVSIVLPGVESASVSVVLSPDTPMYVEFAVPAYALSPKLAVSFSSFVVDPVNIFTPNVTYSELPAPVNISILVPSRVIYSTGLEDSGGFSYNLISGWIYNIMLVTPPPSLQQRNVTVQLSAVLSYDYENIAVRYFQPEKLVSYSYTQYYYQVLHYFGQLKNNDKFSFSLPWFLNQANVSVVIQTPTWLITRSYILSPEDYPLLITPNGTSFSDYQYMQGGESYLLNVSIIKEYLQSTQPTVYISIYANSTYLRFWHYSPFFNYSIA